MPARLSLISVLALLVSAVVHADDAVAPEPEPVSYFREVRPILQRHCSGCHQPSKAGGKLLLTSFDGLQKGGESGGLIVAGKPDESDLFAWIEGDEPEMPRNADPLEPEQIATLRTWIAQGAKNDTPESAIDRITPENPPVYEAPPVVTALAYSPDSKLLAVSGFHETLLHEADGSGLVARLVGRGNRVNSLDFSPDGKLLAVAGGTPALFGELQLWNVEKRSLEASTTVSYDTLFGVRFDNDGGRLVFGAADNSVRLVGVPKLEPLMKLDAHADWTFGSAFSLDDKHLVSVSRDMSAKLWELPNEQFVDNVTSITPGALKGGLTVVRRHPKKDQILTAGADGTPRLYKMFRTRKRIIGDDFNQIRGYQSLPGRVYDLAFDATGERFVVGASTADGGSARIYKTGVYDEKAVNNGGSLGQTRQETAQRTAQKMLVHELPGIDTPVFAVAFRPDGKQVAVAGFDGTIRLYDTETGKLAKKFVPVKVEPPKTAAR